MQHVLGSGALAPGFAPGGAVLPITVEASRIDGNGSFAPGWTDAGVEQDVADPFTSIAAVGFGPDPIGGAVTCAIYRSGGQGVGTLTRAGPNGDGVALRAALPNPPEPAIPMTLVADSAGGAF